MFLLALLCLSACISSRTAKQLFTKFDIGDFTKSCEQSNLVKL
jgi:hypothetical protein